MDVIPKEADIFVGGCCHNLKSHQGVMALEMLYNAALSYVGALTLSDCFIGHAESVYCHFVLSGKDPL